MYSPWNQLPAPEPKDTKYPIGYFYEHTAKHLIKDTVRIMDNGLNIDLAKVVELEEALAEQLAEVEAELAANPLIKKYLELKHQDEIRKYVKERKAKMRDFTYYLVPFKPSDMNHRSYFQRDNGASE